MSQSGVTTPHKLRIEARSRKRAGRHPVVRRTTQTEAEDVSFMQWLDHRTAPVLAYRLSLGLIEIPRG
jgi:hypothetical protein